MDTGEYLFTVEGNRAENVPLASLAEVGLKERQDLQEWIVAHPEVLGSDAMIVAIEYDAWVANGDAQPHRLDILGLDRSGHLIVAELKRGIAPDTVEMQAIKYAAMASRFTLASLGVAHARFLTGRGRSTTAEEASEALDAYGQGLTEEAFSEPRIVLVAQDFSPIVISSVVWLSQHQVDISLVRFQTYRHSNGQVFVTFSRLFPLPDLEKSIIAPGTPTSQVSTDMLPAVEWTTPDLIALGRVANQTTRTILDLCSDRPNASVSLTEVVEVAGVARATARAQLAGLTVTIKRRFVRRNWPFKFQWVVDGVQQASYIMTDDIAARWREAAIQLDLEHSDPGSGSGGVLTPDAIRP